MPVKYFDLIMGSFSKKKLVLLLILVAMILSLQFTNPPATPEKNLEKYYLGQLSLFVTQLNAFEKSLLLNAPGRSLNTSFLQLRLAYKKTAILTEFYNIYESRLLNGPPLPWVTEDNPKQIIEPHGLQVIEEKLFAKNKVAETSFLQKELLKIRSIITTFLKEKNLAYKFRQELIFEALQSSLIRLITLGITGFDSPYAQNSITEAKTTLESFRHIIGFYQKLLDEKTPGHYEKINYALSQSIQYLKVNNNFNSFNRLYFIEKFISPVYKLLVEARISHDVISSGDITAINPLATSLFDTNTFNINAFSPGKYRITKERVALGKKLFYDPLLSATKNRSCGSCHKPELAFTDGLKTALAVDEKTYLLRNTPTLLNSALQTKQFFDSRTSVLENQLNDVVHNQKEMNGSLNKSITDLQSDAIYADWFAKAYSSDYEKITQYNIANAISSYVRSLISFNSNFDLYMRGDQSKLNIAQKNGFNLFTGKAKCATCHYIPLFNGLAPPVFNETESEVIGVPSQTSKIKATIDGDPGKYGFTSSPIHKYSFKTPTLRNIELTAPYMHNGVYKTLEEVVEFYNKGGGKGLKIAPPNQSLPFDKLNLSKKEISDIVSFMKTLTDTTYRQYN
jgi:cytochrome c peroxidase